MSMRAAGAVGLGGLTALFLGVGLPALLHPEPVPAIEISDVAPVPPAQEPDGGDDDGPGGDDVDDWPAGDSPGDSPDDWDDWDDGDDGDDD